MADVDVQQVVEAAARAIAGLKQVQFHGQLCPVWVERRNGVGLDRCTCWIMPRARKQATAAMSVIVPAVTEQIRALHQQRNIREYEERDCADGICDGHHDDISGAEWCPSRIVSVCSRCYSIAAEDVAAEVYEWPCEHVCLLDELDAAARGAQRG